MSKANYKYTLTADSGYKSEQSGKISPERHAVVCAALDGGLTGDVLKLRAAPELLEALEMVSNYVMVMKGPGHEYSIAVKNAIAKAKGLNPDQSKEI